MPPQLSCVQGCSRICISDMDVSPKRIILLHACECICILQPFSSLDSKILHLWHIIFFWVFFFLQKIVFCINRIQHMPFGSCCSCFGSADLLFFQITGRCINIIVGSNWPYAGNGVDRDWVKMKGIFLCFLNRCKNTEPLVGLNICGILIFHLGISGQITCFVSISTWFHASLIRRFLWWFWRNLDRKAMDFIRLIHIIKDRH